ncbi:hypothetical protein HK100_011537 [Physocladia obscura]|uniref:Uncharacterized protein n=1 Tax=Physocladia obscura TaxID=109957 RepID=A0AAD5XD62_9FUNG|nr:hypothetical protein HK100_011537 [Physocladia obscura]
MQEKIVSIRTQRRVQVAGEEMRILIGVKTKTQTEGAVYSCTVFVVGALFATHLPSVHSRALDSKLSFKLGLSASAPFFVSDKSYLFRNQFLSTKSFEYRMRLPSLLPPSYRGKAASISYLFAFCLHDLQGSLVHLFLDYLPRRVLDFSDDNLHENVSSVEELNDSQDDFRVSEVADLFDSLETEEDTDEDEEKLTPAQKLKIICQRSAKVSFDICRVDDIVAHFILVRSAFCAGETVFGVLNFEHAAIPCFQVSAFLEQIETIPVKPNDSNSLVYQNTSPTSPTSSTLNSKQKTVRRIVLSQQHSTTINTLRMDISLPVPTFVTPDFSSTAVSVSYAIRLEFITARRKDAQLMEYVHGSSGRGNASHNEDIFRTQNFVSESAVSTVDVEAFECVLGVHLYPSIVGIELGGSKKSFEFAL